MNKNIAIEFENIGKQYRLGLVSTGTISHDLNRWWTMNVLRKEDPYLKIGETNDRSHKGESEYVWALKDINFKIEQGDVVGIIGKNGAGKSTLLKLLSRVTAPTTGKIITNGRIASLLEVGTGFHPEMTGRENIYMNGAIMGMTKQEISRKLDEIVDFSGCERYIDTPVKRYSSGMTVRLGFAIAAHLELEILVVDEVLAVGDAEFQKKAIGKMKDVSQGGGRTVLFVSHNMAAVKSLCKHGILLENGMVKETGDVDTVVGHYLKGDSAIENHRIWNEPTIKCDGIEIIEIGVRKKDGKFEDTMRIDDPIEIVLKYRITKAFNRIAPAYYIKNEQGEVMFVISASSSSSDGFSRQHDLGVYENICCLPSDFFNWGTFFVDVLFSDSQRNMLKENDIASFTLANKEIPIGQWMGKQPGFLLPKMIKYSEQKIQL